VPPQVRATTRAAATVSGGRSVSFSWSAWWLGQRRVGRDGERTHGEYGYFTGFDVERFFRDAPVMIVGEGTDEIQRNPIAGQLVARGGVG
jgi:hypothetical protein